MRGTATGSSTRREAQTGRGTPGTRWAHDLFRRDQQARGRGLIVSNSITKIKMQVRKVLFFAVLAIGNMSNKQGRVDTTSEKSAFRTQVRHLHLLLPAVKLVATHPATPPDRRGRCTARPHRHTNTTHVTQIRVHLKSSPPPHPTRPPLARAARPRVPRRRRARRRKQQGRRKSTSGLSCPRPRSRSSAACAPAPCRPPSARPART